MPSKNDKRLRDRSEAASSEVDQSHGRSSKKNKHSRSSSSAPEKAQLGSPIHPGLFKRQEELHRFHESSGPYKHVVIDDLCVEARMRNIFEEATSGMVANYKETDLFKVYQTGDLACIGEDLY
jgi:hypothetical protein